MKKKLIQIFMLLVATISVGSFVSCKDTNEDLYNELRTQMIPSNASLKDALDTQEAALADLLQKYKDLKATVDAINSCNCDEAAMQAQIDGLSGDITGLKGDLTDLTNDFNDQIGDLTDLMNILKDALSEKANQSTVDAIVGDLTNQINNIKDGLKVLQDQNLYALILQNKALQDGLETRIAALEAKLASLKEYDDTDILTRLAKAEQAIIDNKAWLDQQIADLKDDVTAAQTTATAAFNLATTANNTADTALDLAKRVETLANQGITDAAKAQAAADLAYQLASKAYETANKVNDLAVTVATLTGRVDANENAIKQLQQETANLRDLIDKNKDNIAENAADILKNATDIANLAKDIEKNANAITDIQKSLQTINDNLTLATATANQALKDAAEAKAKADANEQTISELSNKVTANTTNIENLKTTTDELKNAVNELKSQMAQVAVKTAAIDNLAKAVDDTKDAVKDLADKYDDLAVQLEALKGELQTAKAECAANLREAKAYVDLEIANLKAAVAQQIADELNNYYDKAYIDQVLKGLTTKEELANKILDLYKDMNAGDQALDDKILALAQKVAANERAIAGIEELLQALSGDMKNLAEKQEVKEWLDKLYRVLDEKIALAGGSTTVDIKVLKEEIMQDLIDELTDPDGLLGTLTDQIITNIFEGDTYNYLQKDELEDLVDQIIKEQIDPEEFKQALLDLAALELRVAALENDRVKIADYETDKTALWKAINDNFNTLNSKIGDLQTAVNTINSKLPTMEKDIKDLKDDVKDAQDRLTEIEGKVKDLRTDITDIQNYLAQQVTGITIQGTHNPMFGSFSIPANIQSNFLIAYYGRPATKVEFPTTDDVMYVRKEEVLTDDDWAMINGDDIVFTQKAGKVLMNEYEINDNAGTTVRAASAGKVYVTVNPTSVNAKGLQLDIVNTQDEASLIKLSPLKPSYATLEFGFSRANNGFYEADAYVNIADLDNVERPFDEQAIKDLAKVAKNELKDIISGSMAAGNTGLDVLAVKVYDVVRSLRIDQSGLKCPFKAADGSDQAVYSQYNLAATAVKPVTLGFGKDFDYKTAPGYERVEKMLATIYDKLNGVVVSFNNNKEINNLFRDLDGLNIKHVTLNELSESYLAKFVIEIETSFTIDDVRYDLVLPVDVWVPVKYAEDLTVGATPLTVNASEAVDLSYFDENIASNVKDALFDKIKTQVTKPTVVIKNDDSGNLTSALVVPVNDQSGKVQGFTQFPLETPVALVSGEIQFDGTGIALVSGSSLVTTGYTQNVNIDQLNYSFVFKGKTFEYYKKVDLSDAIKDLWYNQVGEAIGDVNDILDQLNNLIADALKLRDLITRYEGKYTNAVENYFGVEGKLHGYLDKINNVIVNFVNGINWQLGPFIVAEDSKGFKVMSTVKGATVMSKNNLRIYPTSKNLEILVPFARKHVAVTNVFKGSASAQGGDADCLAKLKAANTGDLNKVIDGTQRMIEVTGVESGYTYEFAYSVLDFNGNISTRKTYIKIK